MVEVEILGCVMTAQYGTLKTGDILRTNEAFAAHLVNDCSAAKYVQSVEVAESNGDQEITGDGTGEALPEIEPEPKTRKHKA